MAHWGIKALNDTKSPAKESASESRTFVTFINILFISIFSLPGFAILGYGLWSMKRSTEPASWPTTQGRIVSCALEGDSDDNAYKVQVSYSYSVHGVNFTNDKLAFGYERNSGRNAHQEILSKLEAARTVDVRYDPMDPQTSVLSFGVHRSIQLVIVGAFTWLAFVFGFTITEWVGAQGDRALLRNLAADTTTSSPNRVN